MTFGARFGRPAIDEISRSLVEFPIVPWAGFPTDLKHAFVRVCIDISGRRTGHALAAPLWVIDIVVAGYDRGDVPSALTKVLLCDQRFTDLYGDISPTRRALVAEMIAREPMARLNGLVTHASALTDDDLLQIISPTPVCSSLLELPHLMLDRGHIVSKEEAMPPAWCSNIVCRCEWRIVEGSVSFKQSKKRHRDRRKSGPT